MILECALLRLNLFGSIMSVAPVPHGDCVQSNFCCPFDPIAGIQYYFFDDQNVDGIKILNGHLDDLHGKLAGVNRSLPTVIYIHGYGDHYFSTPGRTILSAYLERKHYNIILVDWSSLSSTPWYITSVRNTPMAASHLVTFIQTLERLGFNASNIHLIGFSLGAQLAGFVGKKLRDPRGGPVIQRITGLDPAYPLYYFAKENQRLDKRDATFVDVIHTNYGFSGFLENIGHADFYVNKIWQNQPGCSTGEVWTPPIDFDNVFGCNHHAAWRLYSRTVRDPDAFKAARCDANGTVLNLICSRSFDVTMGFEADAGTYGIFQVEVH